MLLLNPHLYRLLARPLFFLMPPETAQKAAHIALKQGAAWRMLAPAFAVKDPRLRTELCGMQLDSPVGIAAGFDKNCEMLPSLSALGFGYLTGGTITVEPRAGNPRPRMLRLAAEESLINSLGFPNKGLDHIAERLRRGGNAGGTKPLVLSVSGTTVDDIVTCHRRLEPLADAIEVNISSPNTAGLREFHELARLGELLGRLGEGRTKPLMVKLPPYPDSEDAAHTEAVDRAMALVGVCVSQGIEAVTVANSRPVSEPRLAVGRGGLSGRRVFDAMLRMVSDVKAEVGERVAINACGGIFTAKDAWEALKAGSTTVQLYTGMLYRGPGVVRDINRGLVRLMEAEAASSGPGSR